MAVTINTYTATPDEGGGRRTAIASDGTIWHMQWNNDSNRWDFWYSTDDGATWAENTSLRITPTDSTPERGAFAINTIDDVAVCIPSAADAPQVIAGIATDSSGWVDPAFASEGTTVSYYDVVVFKKPSSTNYYIAGIDEDGSTAIWEITSAGAKVGKRAEGTGLGVNPDGGPGGVDFRHTGDGHTVASSSPHVFSVTDDEGTLRFFKYGWTGSTYTEGTSRIIASVPIGTPVAAAFDGTAFVMAATAVGGEPVVYERDAGDTTTTQLTGIPALGETAGELALTYDADRNITLAVSGTTSDDVEYTTYDRATTTWSAWTVLEATTVVSGEFSAPKARHGSVWPIVWADAGAIKTENVSYNAAPTAPTWVSPADGNAADAGSTLAVDWTFNDPDSGDTQSAYALKRVISGTTTYYQASDSTWQSTEIKNTSTTSGVTLPTTWGADADSVALSVKTWDAADTEGVYGDTITILGSTPVTPALTAPTDSSTVSGPTPTITWTATEQTSYRFRWLTSADAVLYDSGKVASTTKSLTSPYSLADGLVGAKVEVRVWNDDDLEGSTDTHTVDVTYTEPMTPTYVVTATPASGYISVAITDPTPTGSPTPPDVSYHDVYVRVASGGRQVGARTVNDDGIRIATNVASGATFYDYAAPSGVDLEYRTLAVADTGASVYGAWT